MIDEEVQELLDHLAELRRTGAATCFGEPITQGATTIIPVAESAYAFDVGIEEWTSEGDQGIPEVNVRGLGSGNARPLAVIEVDSRGVRVRPVIDHQKIALARVVLGAWIVFWIVGAIYVTLARRS